MSEHVSTHRAERDSRREARAAARRRWSSSVQSGFDALHSHATPYTPVQPGEGDTHVAAELGLMPCHRCGAVWEGVDTDHPRCGRCHAVLHTRKPDSIRRTWAFLLAAAIMYLPANLLPVMITRSLLGTQQDTILSGVIFFWVSGSYGLAALIFTASFLVPLFKLAALFLLVVLAQRRSPWRQAERARLYHALEFIGRWSMLDVFVVALLAGLVQIQGFAVVSAGVGIAAFGAVVVLTMLASLSFDPRLTWDTAELPTGPDAALPPRAAASQAGA